jgi:hypothetical protein
MSRVFLPSVFALFCAYACNTHLTWMDSNRILEQFFECIDLKQPLRKVSACRWGGLVAQEPETEAPEATEHPQKSKRQRKREREEAEAEVRMLPMHLFLVAQGLTSPVHHIAYHVDPVSVL